MWALSALAWNDRRQLTQVSSACDFQIDSASLLNSSSAASGVFSFGCVPSARRGPVGSSRRSLSGFAASSSSHARAHAPKCNL